MCRSLARLVLLVVVALVAETAAFAQPTDVFVSEYIEGTSNNKAIEIYNGTASSINLSTGGYQLEYYFNGSASVGLTIALTGTVAAGDVYVVAQASASAAILAQADQTNSSGWYNGDDAIVLRKGGVGGAIVDSIGQVGLDPGTEWGTGLASTADNTLRRKSTICQGDTNATDVFDPSIEWDGFATDTFGGLGSHSATCGDAAPSVASTIPADNTTGVSLSANITIQFSEAVNVDSGWFAISCTTSGAHTATESGGPTTFGLDPDTDFVNGDTCTVTIDDLKVHDQDVTDPPDTMAADHVFHFSTPSCGAAATLISAIQGSGTTSPMVGNSVTVEAVVVGDFQGSAGLSGFFLQEEAADDDLNPATSEGLFIADGPAPAVPVAAGDRVRVTGTVAESFARTQLGTVTGAEVCATGNPLPAAATVTLPFASATDAERFEGMRVMLSQTLAVTEVFNLGRFGEVGISSGTRLLQPTNVVAPGAPAVAYGLANDLDRLVLDDGKNTTFPTNPLPPFISPYIFDSTANGVADPTLRVGDTLSTLDGVMDFAFSAYRVHPTVAPAFTRSNPRPTQPPPVGGLVRVASMNLLNYFNGDGMGGGFPTSRGADSAAEFARQSDKLVAVIEGVNAGGLVVQGLEPDVLVINELENDAEISNFSAEEELVSRLNSVAGAGTWDFISTGVLGTDEIRVGILYRPGVVTPVGSTATLTTGTFATLSRPPIAQAFQHIASGKVFIVVGNHFKSKSCSGATGADADLGDEQGCYNATRVQSASELLAWLATDPTGTADPDVVILGDLNSYLQENPITTLEGGGFVNLVETRIGTTSSSFLFNGESGSLDQALATPSFAGAVTGTEHFAVNADEPIILDYNLENKNADQQALEVGTPYRASDHDSVLVGLFQIADLVLTKADSPDPVAAGTNLTYTITVTNNGPDAATNASWTDTLPTDTTFVSLPPVAGWSCSTPMGGPGGVVSCSNPSFAVGTAVFTLTVAVAPTVAPGTDVLSNSATATSDSSEGNAGDESDTETTTVTTSADISIIKLDTPDPVDAGENLTYTITVNNAGPSNAASVSVSDTLPPGTTFQSLSPPGGWSCPTLPPVGSGGTVSCSIASLPPGSAVFTLVVAVDLSVADGTTLSNTAMVSSSTTDPTPDDHSATAETTVSNLGNYFTVTPCRAVDSRTGAPLQDGVPQTFALHGVCGIPATATTVVLNLTAVEPTGSGDLAIYASDATPPGFATLPFTANKTRALFVVVGVSNDAAGEVTVQASAAGGGTVDVVIDVMGYFE